MITMILNKETLIKIFYKNRLCSLLSKKNKNKKKRRNRFTQIYKK